MGGRPGSACVIKSTKVNPQGMAQQEIWTIDVVASVNMNYHGGTPGAPSPTIDLVPVTPIAGVVPIKSLGVTPMGNYVYPVYRYQFSNYYGGVANYPLLNIQVKILPAGFSPGNPEPPCLADNCPAITCSLLHPFMKWNGAMMNIAPTRPEATIVPAYYIEKDDLIFVDPNPAALRVGKVESVTRLPPDDVYGLIVLDQANAEIASEIAHTLIPAVNTKLGVYFEQIVERYSQFQLDTSTIDSLAYLESIEFAVSTFAALLSGSLPPTPPATLHGLAPEDYMIITDSIASGALYVQSGYYREARKGLALGALIP
jgi:hypothetical protein